MASQQSTVLDNMLLESKMGSANKVPKLLTMEEYPMWKPRFEIFLDGLDCRLRGALNTEYMVPKGEGNIETPYDKMTVEQKNNYDAEKKAYSQLIQALPNEIFHQFRRYKTSNNLWRALQKRNEGNAALKELKASQLRKELDHFMAIRDEKIPSIITRYNHLLSELDSLGVTVSEKQQVEILAKALPKSWRPFIMILRNTEGFDGMDLNDFITKLKEQEQEECNLDSMSNFQQNPSLYYSGSPVSSTSSSNAPLQSAYMINVNNSGGSTSATSSAGPSYAGSTSGFQAEHFKNGSVEEVKEHMSMLSTLVSSYDDLLKGKIGNAHLTQEDYEQIDEDEMERQDILWSYANIVRRARAYEKRTGRLISATKDTNLGFDKSAVTCYNCGEKGHFARECDKAKSSGPRYPFRNGSGNKPLSSTAITSEAKPEPPKAMATALKAEGIDWSVQFKKEDDDVNVADVDVLNEDSPSETESCSSEGESSATDDDEPTSTPAEEESPVNVRAEKSNQKECSCGKSSEEKVCTYGLPCGSCDDYVKQIVQLKSTISELTANLHENLLIKGREKQLKEKNESLGKQVNELGVALLNKQDAIVFYINEIDQLKRDLATSKIDYETLSQKLKSYKTSSYLFEYIIDQRGQGTDSEKDKKLYSKCPPPVLNQLVNDDVHSESDPLLTKVEEISESTLKEDFKINENVGQPQKNEIQPEEVKKAEPGIRELLDSSDEEKPLMHRIRDVLRKSEKEGVKSPDTLPYQEVKRLPKHQGLGFGAPKMLKSPERKHPERICYGCRKPGHLSSECDQRSNQSCKRKVENFQNTKTFNQNKQNTTCPAQQKRKLPFQQNSKWTNKLCVKMSKDSSDRISNAGKKTGTWMKLPVIGSDGKPKFIRAWVSYEQ